MARLFGLIICLMAVLMPWRLRVAFSEALGWLTQAVYFTYYGIFNFILKELREAETKPALKGTERQDD